MICIRVWRAMTTTTKTMMVFLRQKTTLFSLFFFPVGANVRFAQLTSWRSLRSSLCARDARAVHGRDDEITRRRAPAGAGAEAGVPGFILRRRRPLVVETANVFRRCQQRNARETVERIDRFRRRARESHAFEPVPQYHTFGLGARRRRVRRRHKTVIITLGTFTPASHMYTITIVSWHMKTLILVAFLFERRRRTLAAVFCAFVSKLSSFSFSNEEEESNQISSHTKRRSKVVYYSLCSSSTQQNTKNDAADDDGI